MKGKQLLAALLAAASVLHGFRLRGRRRFGQRDLTKGVKECTDADDFDDDFRRDRIPPRH